jgi:hypothetical protein
MNKSAVPEEPKKARATQRVFEAKWQIPVDDKEEIVTQLFCGKDFQQAFFKSRAWAKENVTTEGVLVSMTRREDMVI